MRSSITADGIVMRHMPTVTTQVTELPESRVRVEAEVAPAEIERRMTQAAAAVGRDLRIPGFRKGKVPPPVVMRRVGREAILDQAVRDALPAWYGDAIGEAGITPVGEPDVDLSELPGQGEPLRFAIEIGVRPTAALGDYKGLEVPRREPRATDEQVDAELETMRERLAKLETAQRPATSGDFVVIDYTGTMDGEPFAGGEGRDELLELGAGRVVPDFEEQLVGARAGEERGLAVTFPDDHPAKQIAGREASFAVTVKEVKEKALPPLDDDFASDAAGMDTVAELREDIARRITESDAEQVEGEFREAALDAAADHATVEVPEALTDARAKEMWDEMGEALRRQGVSKEGYLRLAGKTEEELLGEARPDAERALRREAVLAAVITVEGIEPSDEELMPEIVHAAEHENVKPEKLLKRLRGDGRLEDIRSEEAGRQALDLLAREARPIPPEQAEAREKLWTPESEGQGSGSGQLWTPDP